MRIGWLHDVPPFVGGAELTERALRAAKPDGVELVDCPPGQVADNCDRFCIHNCITYSLDDLRRATSRPAFKLWNDVGSWYDEAAVRRVAAKTTAICCSPLQAEYMRLDALTIPPAIDLRPFEAAAAQVNGNRAGVVSVGSWRNRGKGAHRVQAWANGSGVDFYGAGAFAPPGSREIAYQGMPQLLARYRTFVFLPDVIEPFGRCVAEAWAAGCEIVVNGLVGARYWIEEQPDRLYTAAEDYWQAVLA